MNSVMAIILNHFISPKSVPVGATYMKLIEARPEVSATKT